MGIKKMVWFPVHLTNPAQGNQKVVLAPLAYKK
ncbi:MAG: hypothetical protein K0S80_4641 [Neobacillus sp.]|nr:hypothetical protein [Neobacillus sp.]